MREPVCVYCRKHPADAVWRPFCSERCKLLDLAKWVDGSYRIPAESDTESANSKEKSENNEDHNHDSL